MADRLVHDAFKQLMARKDLTVDQTEPLLEQIMTGQVEPELLAGVLVAWSIKGESVDELVGAARVMRRLATAVRCPGEPVDTCGTGGDGKSTFNVSTCAAIIAAGAGVVVAKHGNRTYTRASGSADAMAALGADVDAPVEVIERCLAEVGLGFLYAVKMHPAMRHAASARRLLGIKSIFNIVGPLTNPAGARRQVLGVNRPEAMDLIAAALQKLDTKHALVVHGGGLCDMTITGPSRVIEVRPEGLREWTITPGEVGLPQAELASLLVDSPARSAQTIRAILSGRCGPCRDIAVLNAGAAIYVSGQVADLAEGVRAAQRSIDSGAARAKMDQFLAIGGKRQGQ
jgi:anthranilate phosphoribosyltransferase